ncbi:hypothetical protein LCGC14_1056340 [marine sediment metagenome]|uniref:Uncharacterized protein n=1 Tax=marine sediment metagenome TaxID=412755 RepID=A0A0F9Q5E6_9ZZZZ
MTNNADEEKDMVFKKMKLTDNDKEEIKKQIEKDIEEEKNQSIFQKLRDTSQWSEKKTQ